MNQNVRIKWLILFGICAFIGLLSFSISYTEERLDGGGEPFYYQLIYEMTGAFSVFLLLPLVLRGLQRFPIRRTNWYRIIPLHLLFSAFFGVSHTLLMTLSRKLIFAFLDLGTYKMGDLFFRFLMEYQKQFLIYIAIAIGDHVIREFFVNQEREKKTAELELQTEQYKGKLIQSQLEALKGQIQPHFLFNTLNMISSTMYEDVAKADGMIMKLSSMLRLSLEKSNREEISVREELQFLEPYLDLMKARFEENFHFSASVEPETASALIPGLLLQPLIENAIKHNDGEEIRIELYCRKEEDSLVLEIEDNGPGLSEESSPFDQGIGLSNSRNRLHHLYGDRAGLQLRNRPSGGLTVRVTLPFTISPAGDSV